MASNCSWKDDIMEKLAALLEDEPETLTKFIEFLGEKDSQIGYCSDNDTSPAWEILKYTIASDTVFRDYALRLAVYINTAAEDAAFRETIDEIILGMLENLWNSDEMASPVEFAWEDNVRGKLIEMFENDPETMRTLLSYLDEGDDSGEDGGEISHAWRTLYSAMDSDGAFNEYATRLAEDAKKDFLSTQEIEVPRNSNGSDSPTDCPWKQDVILKLTDVFQYDNDMLDKILSRLHEAADTSPDDGMEMQCAWMTLYSAIDQIEEFKECAKFLVRDRTEAGENGDSCDNVDLRTNGNAETLQSLNDFASPAWSWKDEIRGKLMGMFASDPETLGKICSRLHEDAIKSRDDSTDIERAWMVLYSFIEADEEFKGYATSLVNDTTHAEEKRAKLDIPADEIMENSSALNDTHCWKEDISNKLLDTFEHDEDILNSILTQLIEEDEAFKEGGTTDITPLWKILRDAFCMDNIEQEDAERFMEVMDQWNPENDFAWKTHIRIRLINVLENDPEGIGRIFDFLEGEDEIHQDGESAGNQSIWNVFKSVLDSDEIFKEYAERLAVDIKQAEGDAEFRKIMKLRYDQLLEDTQKPKDDECWKDDVRSKLISTFEDDIDTVACILFYLDNEETAYKDNSGLEPPVWKFLKSLLETDVEFREYAERLAEDIKMAENDDAYKVTFNILYSQMLKPMEEPTPADHGQRFTLALRSPKVSTFRTPDAAMKFINSIAKNPRHVAILGKVVGPLALSAYMGFKTIRSVWRWWKGDISGKRCAKEIVDSTATLAAGIAGGMAGSALGNFLGGPVGAMIGSNVVSILAASVTDCLCSRLTQWLFEIPADEALEKAYNFLGVPMTASNNEVNKAYRWLCLQHHPDKSGGNSEDFILLQIHIGVIKEARKGL